MIEQSSIVNTNKYTRKRAERNLNNNTHSYESKMLALAVYSQTLSCNTASRETGIPAATIYSWSVSEEGIATISELQATVRSVAAHKFLTIAVTAAEQLLDRIHNGDEVLDSKGNLVRRKMSGKDLAHATSIATDKYALMTKGTQGNNASVNKQLLDIVGKLAALATNTVDKPVDNS